MAAHGDVFAKGAAGRGLSIRRRALCQLRNARRQLPAGKCIVTNGPFAGWNELIAGFAMVQVKSKEEAVEWAERLAKVMGDGEIEAGLVKAPWDLGLCPEAGRCAASDSCCCKRRCESEGAALPLPAVKRRWRSSSRKCGGPASYFRRGTGTQFEGRQTPARWRQADGDGWTVYRVQGADWRLRDHSGRVESTRRSNGHRASPKVFSDAEVVGDVEIDVRPTA